MPQNDRNSRNRKRRRAYDQARDDRRGGQRFAEQAAQVVDGHPQHMVLPGVAAQEP